MYLCPQTNASHWRQKFFYFFPNKFSAPLIGVLASHSLTAPPSTSWVTCLLFVATPMNWEYTCTVCGHYSVLCLWPLLQIVSTHVLFVATPVNSLQCTPLKYVGACVPGREGSPTTTGVSGSSQDERASDISRQKYWSTILLV